MTSLSASWLFGEMIRGELACWRAVHEASVIADLLQILAAIVFCALVNAAVMLSTSFVCSFAFVPVVFQFSVSSEKHAMDWDNVEMIGVESDKAVRLVREAMWNRKSNNVNRDEGNNYQMSQIWHTLVILPSKSFWLCWPICN